MAIEKSKARKQTVQQIARYMGLVIHKEKPAPLEPTLLAHAETIVDNLDRVLNMAEIAQREQEKTESILGVVAETQGAKNHV